MSLLRADAFPEAAVRARASAGPAAAFPDPGGYGRTLYGSAPDAVPGDMLDELRLVPPVFVPHRLAKLVDLGR